MHTTREDHLRQLWNDSAKAYDEHTRRYPTHQQITTLLLANLTSQPTSMLDVGCGPGNSTRLLRQRLPHAHLVGLDTAPAMITIAEQTTDPGQKITYRCAALDAFTRDWGAQFTTVLFSNSFFHIEDTHRLLDQVDNVLTRDGTIAFSLYESVFVPTTRPAWPLAVPAQPDPLMDLLIQALRERGHTIDGRKQDRPILTEARLADLFTGHGFTVRCAAMLRLRRTARERLAFFRIPAMAAEVFPDIEPATVAAAIDTLRIPAGLADQERLVYAFTAQRASGTTRSA